MSFIDSHLIYVVDEAGRKQIGTCALIMKRSDGYYGGTARMVVQTGKEDTSCMGNKAYFKDSFLMSLLRKPKLFGVVVQENQLIATLKLDTWAVAKYGR